MTPFEFLAAAFAAVALLNLALLRKRGVRAIGIALAAAICAYAAYIWDANETALPKWLVAAAVGVFMATVLYESGRRKADGE